MTRLPRLMMLAERGNHERLLEEGLSAAGPMPVSVRLALGADDALAVSSTALAFARASQLTFGLAGPAEGLLRRLLDEVEGAPSIPAAAAAAAFAAVAPIASEPAGFGRALGARAQVAAEHLERSLAERLGTPALDDVSLASVAIVLGASGRPETDALLCRALEAAADRGLMHHPTLGPELRAAEDRLLFTTPIAA